MSHDEFRDESSWSELGEVARLQTRQMSDVVRRLQTNVASVL